MNRIIAIDFDGTIVDHEYPEIGQLKANAKNVINKLYDQGHAIVIWTCRYLENDLEAMKKFLKDNRIKYHTVNENVFYKYNFDPKPKIYYDVLVDDRNLGGVPEDWDVIYSILKLQFPDDIR